MADEPLGRMVIELGLDDAGLGKGLQGARKAVRSSMSEMKASMAVIGQAGSKFDVLSAKSSGLAKTILAQRGEVNELGKAYKNSLVDGKPTAQTAKLASQFNNASAKLAALNKQYVANARAAAEVKVQTTGITGAMNTVGNGAVKVGRSVSGVGDTMTKRVTAPIALGFAAAGKAAISFNSQIDAMGPLLTNGGAVTAKYRAQLDQMAESSKKWAVQYGISTTQINNGMSELVKRGFTTNQVLGSMPSILDATKASGEDMGTVMNATASIVEQFGLKTKSTTGTMKNTQMVTDSLTYAANATASGFGDLSEAFSYVGPVAASAGLSVQQTAAAIGVLSDRGIEGQKAGTGLRSILTSLVKPTRAAKGAFDEMGISSSELKRDSKDLPQLIRDITEGTKGWDKADRNKAIATAFGKENQTAMNALISAGADKLQNLTDKTNAAGGATKRVAEEMMKTPAERLKRLQQQFEVTAITLGEKLMPYIVKGMDTVGKLADAFGNLSPKMQDFIVKLGVGAAAAGPLLSVFGRLTTGSGKVLTGIVKLAAKLAGLKAARTAASDLGVLGAASNTTKDQLSLFGNAAEGVGTKATSGAKGFTIFGKALTTGGTSAGVLGSALTPLGATVLGVGAAVAAGTVVWELWGKKAHENAVETEKWGTSVGSAADKSLTSLQNFSGQTTALMNAASAGTLSNTKEIQKAFGNMAAKIEVSSQREIDAINKTKAALGKGYDTTALDQKKQYYQQSVDLAQHATKVIDEIEQGQSQSKRKRTSADNQMILNAQNDLIQAQIKGLGLSQKKQQIIADNFAESFKGKSVSQLNAMNDAYVQAASKTKAYKTALDAVKAANEGASASAKSHNWAKFVSDNVSTLRPVYDNYLAQVKKINSSNESQADKSRDLQSAYGDLALEVQKLGIPFDTFMAAVKKADKTTKDTADGIVSTSSKMSDSVHHAANTWNDLVFDPKTGKIKTNAAEEIAKAKKGSDTWDSINLLIKTGKMDVKGLEQVSKATLATNDWNKLSPKNQLLVAKVTGNDKIIDAVGKFGLWNSLTPQQKTAVAQAKGKDEVFAAIGGIDRWNASTPEQKNAIIKAAGKENVEKSVLTMQSWNAMTPEQKKATVQTLGGETVTRTIMSMQNWNSMTPKQQQATVQSMGNPELLNMIGGIDKFNGLNPHQKHAVAVAIGNGDVTALTSSMNMWSGLTPSQKWAIANTSGSDKVWSAIQTFGGWNKLTPKQQTAIAKQVGKGDVQGAISTIMSWNKTSPGGTKTAKAKDSASGPMGSATRSTKIFKSTSPGGTKTANGRDNTSRPLGAATRSTNIFRGTSPGSTKNANGSDHTSQPFGTAKRSIDRFRGTSPGGAKRANAVDNASGPANSASRAVNNFSAKRSHTVTLTTITRHITEFIKKHLKGGTSDFEGGTMMVNDQAGPLFRELVQFPTGETFVPHGRNVILNAPRHTRVVPAGKTNRLLGGIPQFAGGVGGIPENADYLQDARNLTTQLNQQVVQMDDSRIVSGLEGLGNALAIVVKSMQQFAAAQGTTNTALNNLLNQGQQPIITKAELNIDGKKAAESLIGPLQDKMNRDKNLSDMAMGIRPH